MLEESKKTQLINGWIYFDDGFIPFLESIKLFEDLKSNLNWQESTIKVFGKEYLAPRKEAYYADYKLNYAYSGH